MLGSQQFLLGDCLRELVRVVVGEEYGQLLGSEFAGSNAVQGLTFMDKTLIFIPSPPLQHLNTFVISLAQSLLFSNTQLLIQTLYYCINTYIISIIGYQPTVKNAFFLLKCLTSILCINRFSLEQQGSFGGLNQRIVLISQLVIDLTKIIKEFIVKKCQQVSV